jgi:hypothetical protein
MFYSLPVARRRASMPEAFNVYILGKFRPACKIGSWDLWSGEDSSSWMNLSSGSTGIASYHVADSLHGAVHGCINSKAQADSQLTALGLASQDRHLLGKETQCPRQLHRAGRLGKMRINAPPAMDTEISGTGRKHVKRPRRLTATDRIHHDDGFKAFHQPEHKVHAPDSHVHGFDTGWQCTDSQPFDDLDAEAIISKKHIPKANN